MISLLDVKTAPIWGRLLSGGSGEIRTHGDIPASVLFKSTALNHSATLPIFARILAGLRK